MVVGVRFERVVNVIVLLVIYSSGCDDDIALLVLAGDEAAEDVADEAAEHAVDEDDDNSVAIEGDSCNIEPAFSRSALLLLLRLLLLPLLTVEPCCRASVGLTGFLHHQSRFLGNFVRVCLLCRVDS